MRANHLLLRGYGPLVAFVVFFGLMALMAPTVSVDGHASGASGPQASGGQDQAAPGTPLDESGVAADGESGQAAGPEASGPGADGSGGTAGDGGDAANGGGGGGDGGGGQGGGQERAAQGVQPCGDRELQVPGDPYSPPCVVFDGDNGGATSQGVDEDTILITARTPDQSGFQDELANLADADISDTQQDVRRTISALVDYFNERFEFHGRQLQVEFYDGQGDTTAEALGGGHEGAQADALTVADEYGAFAELNGATEPFGDALAQNGVLAIGAAHMSREWHTERRPYTWSTMTDCTVVSESASDFAIKRLRGRKAEFAGDPQFQERERDMALIAPENQVYQQCVDRSFETIQEAGHEPPERITYQLDISSMSNQAANIIARLQNEGFTTVQCSCDPVLPVFLTARAQEQDYHPEWIITGTGYTDRDVVGQLMNQEQWSRTFGISYAGAAQPMEGSLGYNAYKQVRDDEPAFAVGTIYYSLYLLALGIQGAGPELTPETFEQGMFDYPGGSGPAGTWGFGPQNYTSTEDFREIYWDPEEISTFNNKQGAYVETDPGERHRAGELPEGPPRVPW